MTGFGYNLITGHTLSNLHSALRLTVMPVSETVASEMVIFLT